MRKPRISWLWTFRFTTTLNSNSDPKKPCYWVGGDTQPKKKFRIGHYPPLFNEKLLILTHFPSPIFILLRFSYYYLLIFQRFSDAREGWFSHFHGVIFSLSFFQTFWSSKNFFFIFIFNFTNLESSHHVHTIWVIARFVSLIPIPLIVIIDSGPFQAISCWLYNTGAFFFQSSLWIQDPLWWEF